LLALPVMLYFAVFGGFVVKAVTIGILTVLVILTMMPVKYEPWEAFMVSLFVCFGYLHVSRG
jgi:hypothetical protein